MHSHHIRRNLNDMKVSLHLMQIYNFKIKKIPGTLFFLPFPGFIFYRLFNSAVILLCEVFLSVLIQGPEAQPPSQAITSMNGAGHFPVLA